MTLAQVSQLDKDIGSYRKGLNPLSIISSPLVSLFEAEAHNERTPEESFCVRYNLSLGIKELDLYNNSRLSLKEVTPVRDMVRDMETIALISLVSEEGKELCFNSKNFVIPGQPIDRDLDYTQVYKVVNKTSYWVENIEPYYIGTVKAVTRLLEDLEESARIIALPRNSRVSAYSDFQKVGLDSKVVKCYSNNIGLLNTYVGEEPDQSAMPWLRVGSNQAPPSPPIRATQCGACYQFVPNKQAFEVLSV